MADRLGTGFVSVLLVGAGGFLGAAGRFGVGIVVPGLVGTLLVNVACSVALGILLYWTLATGRPSSRTRLLLGTGLLASFTTYSTFAVESVQSGPALFVANVAATYLLGFGGVLLGRWIVARRQEGWA